MSSANCCGISVRVKYKPNKAEVETKSITADV